MRRMSAFEFWMRTGRLLNAPYLTISLETKFNQMHYPENGQFAPRGAGVHYGPGYGGFGGGGDGFDGGGASGSWGGFGGGDTGGGGASGSWPAPAKPNTTTKPNSKPGPPSRQQPSRQPARQTIVKNGYSSLVNSEGRTHQVSGQLHFNPSPNRSRRNQRQAGGADRRDSDDGGHFIAARFNGPRDKFNHFAQNANFNRGAHTGLWRTAG